ncbi:hypothetical protein P171DRAFT_51232 [Karstenula rhodostoma CBS 690.94]|uniref:Uncharacterized protein n=1 Tax=Karstenula rhodostoma CBS 690.94 TaxID=1392251 RepID=A0A9P4PF86_9PLEO|nr:hypothetical protein P171DRAFT_51232 [Karstenula rhodostoma CBS 690.94]
MSLALRHVDQALLLSCNFNFRSGIYTSFFRLLPLQHVFLGLVVMISACHRKITSAGDRGSIPRGRVYFCDPVLCCSSSMQWVGMAVTFWSFAM